MYIRIDFQSQKAAIIILPIQRTDYILVYWMSICISNLLISNFVWEECGRKFWRSSPITFSFVLFMTQIYSYLSAVLHCVNFITIFTYCFTYLLIVAYLLVYWIVSHLKELDLQWPFCNIWSAKWNLSSFTQLLSSLQASVTHYKLNVGQEIGWLNVITRCKVKCILALMDC